MRDPDDWGVSTTESPHVDITAEETCPAPPAQVPASDEALQRAPAIQAAQAPSATTFELMSQLETLAHDLAVRERASSDQCIENVHEGSDFSAGLQAVEPSIRVPPRPASFENDPFASDRPPIGRRTVLTLASFFMAALIGVTLAWQSHRVGIMSSLNDVDAAAQQPASTPSRQASASEAALSQSVPVTQSVPAPAAPATSPELVQQLEAMAQDIALVRRGVEQLAAKQEQLAAAQQQLEQLAAKQGQLATRQEQMAQNITKLQALEQNIRHKTSSPRQSRAVPAPPRMPSEPAAQLSSVPRSAPHPVPPLPVPP
jgi:chemotaxis protein histidine kinase CheA